MPEETLYSVFRQSTAGLKTARQEADKLKAINSTGRVDFVIQVLHIPPCSFLLLFPRGTDAAAF
jgi:hypothetical protein